MGQVIVDIADMQISSNPEDTLVTYSLGSCLGITVWDPDLRVGGMIHCMLPVSSVDPVKAQEKPSMFVDTGLTLLLTQLFEKGVRKNRAVVKVAGGSRLLDKNDLFRIGERNYTIFRKMLWKNGMMIKGEDVGGAETRTVRLEIATGRFTIKSSGQEKEL
jgi:chemotaxis protein CheD